MKMERRNAYKFLKGKEVKLIYLKLQKFNFVQVTIFLWLFHSLLRRRLQERIVPHRRHGLRKYPWELCGIPRAPHLLHRLVQRVCFREGSGTQTLGGSVDERWKVLENLPVVTRVRFFLFCFLSFLLPLCVGGDVWSGLVKGESWSLILCFST